MCMCCLILHPPCQHAVTLFVAEYGTNKIIKERKEMNGIVWAFPVSAFSFVVPTVVSSITVQTKKKRNNELKKKNKSWYAQLIFHSPCHLAGVWCWFHSHVYSHLPVHTSLSLSPMYMSTLFFLFILTSTAHEFWCLCIKRSAIIRSLSWKNNVHRNGCSLLRVQSSRY